MIFIKFEKGKQNKFLKEIKKRSNKSWPEIAKESKKSKDAIYTYLREKCHIPKEVFNILSKKYKIYPKNIQEIKIKHTKKKIKIPRISNKLSEFIGAVVGDGHLHKYPSELAITCHKVNDREYIFHLKKIFQELFKKEPTLIEQKNVIKLRYYSVTLIKKLNQKYQIPIGKKKGKLQIPDKIKKQESYLICFIRGVFDTDGSVYQHHKNNVAIEIISADKKFLNEINQALTKLNFKTSISYKGVKIYRQKEIARFFKIIKPANKKHQKRYETFKKSKL